MRIAFVLPAIGKKPGQRYIGTWKMEALAIAVLQALTPPEVETVFYDDRIELIDYDAPIDAVMIPVESYTAKRSYAIAARFRSRGVRVVLGGYHVTLVPDEAARHADAIVTGNAESVWGTLMHDLKVGLLQAHYRGGLGECFVMPDRTIYKGKSYLPISLVETGRGCNNHCEFCAIASYYHCRYRARPIEDVLADVETSHHRYHFLVDDNLVANRGNAIALFEALAPARIKWGGQGTLSMAKDEALLCAMKQSGCELMLIGFESLNEDNLRQMGKSVNLALSERDELVQRIHDAGIGIYATFVFGYDGDDESSFDATMAFAQKHRFYTAAFNHLLPFPGTPLYARLRAQGRLLYPAWWLADGYRYGELAFAPQNMSADRMSELCRQARKAFAAPQSVLARGLASMRRSSVSMWSLFWAMNLRLGEEVDQKMRVPIGENLDDFPK